MRGGWVGSNVWDEVPNKYVFFDTFPYQLTKGSFVTGAVEADVLYNAPLVFPLLCDHPREDVVLNLLFHLVDVGVDPFTGAAAPRHGGRFFDALPLNWRTDRSLLRKKVKVLKDHLNGL